MASPRGLVSGAVAFLLVQAGFDAQVWSGQEVDVEVDLLIADSSLSADLDLPRCRNFVTFCAAETSSEGSALGPSATPDDLVELAGKLLGSPPAAVAAPLAPPSPASIRLVYAAAPPFPALAVAGWLAHQDDLEVVAVVHDGERALAAVEDFSPDVVMLDRSIDGPDALESCTRLRAALSSTAALVVDQEGSRVAMLAALEAGASGFCQDDSLESLREAVQRLGRGEASIPPQLLGKLLRDLIDRRRSHDAVLQRWLSLSRRERDVVRILARGGSFREVAARLYISVNTARTHIQNVLRKLQVHSQAEAVALTLDHDLFNRFADEPREAGADDE